jgi:hypothetical protein
MRFSGPAAQTGSGKYTGFFLTNGTVGALQPRLVVNFAEIRPSNNERKDLSFGTFAALGHGRRF